MDSFILDGTPLDPFTIATIADFLPYPFLIGQKVGDDYQVLYQNKAFRHEIGYSIAEIPTIDDWFIKAYPDQTYRESVIQEWNTLVETALLDGKESIKLQVRVTTKEQGECWYRVKASITGNTHFVAFINLQSLITTTEQLKQLNVHKDKMLALLGHDIRGPIGQVLSLTQLAANKILTQQEYLDSIHKINADTFKVLELIDTTLHWAKSNFDSLTIMYEDINLHNLTQEVIGIYRNMYEPKSIVIHNAITEIHTIRADRSILKAIMRNLISNAIKFTPHAGRIQVSAAENQVSISDTGIGMSPQVVSGINERQYKSRSGTADEAGMGLGLKLILDLLDRINAKMEIVSHLNRGTNITINFNP